MRSILRHDPDVVLVGEIRDSLTAEIAVKLSNTGHITLSTLHTNDAPSTISRLYKMGIEPFLLAQVINIIIAQRLIRKLCPSCKIPLPKEKYHIALEFGLSEEDLISSKIYDHGPGCKKCIKGYKGRTTIAEALYFTPEIRRVVFNCSTEINEEKIKEVAKSQGMHNLKDSGILRIKEGITSIEEIIYATSAE